MVNKNILFVLAAALICGVAKGQELQQYDTLARSVVTAERDIISTSSTQTGLTKLDAKKFNRGFALFSTPDIIKTLQTLPGVSSGTELMSGLYVHGGIGSDNLYLLDGVPLYQISHFAGLFSSFNTDMTRQVDFYKSGFPARYGGRMSSVVDVTTREGDFYKYHGVVGIGLIDGRLQFEGPIVKGKTSFNFGLRRSWLDVITVPAFAYVNHKQNSELHDNMSNDPSIVTDKYNGRYAFWDANARLTHIFSQRSRLSLNFYMGRDVLPINYRTDTKDKFDSAKYDWADMEVKIKWGNIIGSAVWDYQIKDNMTLRVNGYYTGYEGLTYAAVDQGNSDGENSEHGYNRQVNVSGINDGGLRADFEWSPAPAHHIRAGVAAAAHWFTPERSAKVMMEATGMETTEINEKEDGHYFAAEPSLYAEDEMALLPWLNVNVGLRYAAWKSGAKTYHKVEPRASMRFTLSPSVNIKASYTDMNQFNHLVSSVYLDLPGNLWMPSTEMVKPMHSRQFAGGVYTSLPHNVYMNLEGWYKTMDHIVEYVGANAIFPPIDKWENEFTAGIGKSYGAEFEIGWRDAKTDISAAYTLSWSKRKFDDIYSFWYPDRLDNRHKITLMASRRLTKRLEMYLGWNYHTGNRVTVASQHLNLGGGGEAGDIYGYNLYDIYDSPNNLQLPAYHRLDLGFNFHKTTRRGNESVWNLSFYNAYCRLNPIMGEISSGNFEDVSATLKKRQGTAYGIIPIIPSFSYTYKF